MVHAVAAAARRRTAVGVALLVLLTVSGCGTDDAEAGLSPPVRLTVEADVADQNRRARPVGVTRTPRKDSARAVRPPHKEDRGDRWRPVADVSDPARDHGRGPTYADLRGVRVTERGRRLRVVVRLDGVPPARLARREVQTVGIVLGDGDDRHELLLAGGDQGWRAHLRTPGGYEKYPGTARLDGTLISVRVPWESVGGRRGSVSAYVDWSAGTTMLSTDGTAELSLE